MKKNGRESEDEYIKLIIQIKIFIEYGDRREPLIKIKIYKIFI